MFTNTHKLCKTKTITMSETNTSLNTDDAKFFNFPLASNRDFNRINRACSTLEANVLSLISHESLVAINKNIESRKRKFSTNENIESDNMEQLSTLVNLAIDINKESKSLFNKCQRTVSKVVAEHYSSSQHNMMMRSTKYGKPIIEVDALSPCLSTNKFKNMYCDLHAYDPSELPASLPVKLQSNISSIHNSDSTNNVSDSMINNNESDMSQLETLHRPNDDVAELDNYLVVYCNSKLPPVKAGYRYNTPYKIAELLASIGKSFSWKNHSISSYTLMTFLIKTLSWKVRNPKHPTKN